MGSGFSLDQLSFYGWIVSTPRLILVFDKYDTWVYAVVNFGMYSSDINGPAGGMSVRNNSTSLVCLSV